MSVIECTSSLTIVSAHVKTEPCQISAMGSRSMTKQLTYYLQGMTLLIDMGERVSYLNSTPFHGGMLHAKNEHLNTLDIKADRVLS